MGALHIEVVIHTVHTVFCMHRISTIHLRSFSHTISIVLVFKCVVPLLHTLNLPFLLLFPCFYHFLAPVLSHSLSVHFVLVQLIGLTTTGIKACPLSSMIHSNFLLILICLHILWTTRGPRSVALPLPLNNISLQECLCIVGKHQVDIIIRMRGSVIAMGSCWIIRNG